MSDLTLQRVGPTYGGSGTAAPLRGDITGAQVVTDAHGRYFEAARGGSMFTLTTAYAGVTLVAASAIGQTAWSPAVGLFNPLSSGKILSVVAGFANYLSGTPTSGGLVWGFIPPSAGVTAAGGNGGVNNFSMTTGGSAARTFVMSAMTGSAAVVQLCPFPASTFAGAVAATTPLGAWHDVAGTWCVPPGGAIGITGTLGTATVVAAGLIWEELPYLL